MREDKPGVTGDHRTGSALTDGSAGPSHLGRVLLTKPIDSPRQGEVRSQVHSPVGSSREQGQRKHVKPTAV